MHAEGIVKVIIDLDGTRQGIQNAIYIHPALPEVVKRAFSGQYTRGTAATPSE